MKFSSTLLPLAVTLISSLTLSVAAQASNDDPRGKEIYMTSPSCDHYQCQVTWSHGSSQKIVWLNAPKGGLKIQLLPGDGAQGLHAYTITPHVSSTASQNECKSQSNGEKCGVYHWTVPADVKPGHYTVAASSLAQPNKIGYTDTVVVKKGKSRRSVA